MDDKDRNKTNCPNCGAPLNQNGHCDYCGTNVNDACHERGRIEITADGIVLAYY